MTTFQKEIELELVRVREEISGAQAIEAPVLVALQNSLKDVESKLASYVNRAEQPDTVYGEKMKARIKTAKADLECLQEGINSLLVALDGSVHVPEQEGQVACDPEREQSLMKEEDFQAKEQASQQKELAPPVELVAASADAILEAARRVESLQKQMKLQDQERQKAAAAEERRIREELRRKEEAKLVGEQSARAKAMEELHRAVCYGTVNHIVGTVDLDNKVRLLGNRPLVIDWFANWCGPCRMMAPIYEEFARRYREVAFFSVNTELDANQPLMQSRGIRALPTFQLFAHGKLTQTIQGADRNALELGVQRLSEAAEEVMLEEALLLSANEPAIESVNDHQRSSNSSSVMQPRSAIYDSSSGSSTILELKVFGPKKKFVTDIALEAQAGVKDLIREVEANVGYKGPVLVFYNGILLDSRRKNLTLRDIGLQKNAVIRVVPVEQTISVGLKIGESVSQVSLRKSSILATIKLHAQRLTKTVNPKLIFGGKILDAPQNLISEFGVSDGSTVICIPAGDAWNETQIAEEIDKDGLSSTASSPPIELDFVEGKMSGLWKRVEKQFAEKNNQMDEKINVYIQECKDNGTSLRTL